MVSRFLIQESCVKSVECLSIQKVEFGHYLSSRQYTESKKMKEGLVTGTLEHDFSSVLVSDSFVQKKIIFQPADGSMKGSETHFWLQNSPQGPI